MSGRDIEFGIRITGDGKVLISEAGKAEKALEGITTSVKGTQRASEAMTGSMARMGHAMAAAFSIREMASAFDAWQGLYSRVDRASESIEQTGRSMTAIYGIAQRSGVALAEVGDVYQKISRNARQYGLEQADTLRVTEAIANAVRLSGGSAAGAQAALMQFGQALSAGQLRGEELNSVLEQTPELADAIARGMGKTVGELKALGEAGQLTAKEVLGAISQESARLEQEVGAMASTVGQATTRLQNAFTKWVGTETAGAAAVATTALNTVAEHFDKVATGAMLAGTAWAGIRVASLATGFAASAGAMTAAAGGLAVALGPIAPIALAVTAAVVAGAVAWQDYGAAGKTATEEVAVGVRRLQSDLARANVEISAMTRKAYDAQLAEFSQRRAAAAVNVANANMALERFSGNKVSEEYREIYIRAVDANREMKAVNTSLAAFEARAGEVGRKPLDEYFEKFGSKAYKAAQSVKDLDAAYKKVRDRAAADGVGADMLGKLDADYRAERAARAGAGKAAATRASSSTDDARVLADWKERVALQKAESEATDKLTRTQQAYVKLQADLDNGRVKLASSARAQVEAEAQNALQLEAVAEATKKAKAEQEAMAKAQEAAVSAVRADTQALLSKLAVAEQEAETYGMTEESVYRLLAARAADRAEMNAFGDANDTVIAELKAQEKAYLDLAEAAGAKASREATRKAGEDARASAQRFSDDLERALTDSLMRSFEAGKGFGEAFLDSIKNMLKTAALKAVVQVVMSPVTGGISGVAGASMSSSGAGGGSSLMGSASNINTLSNLGGYASIGYQWATGGMSGVNAVGTVTANATGSGLDGLIAATDGWGTVAADAGSTTAAGMSGWGLAGGALGGAMLGYQLTDGNALGTFAGGAGGIAAYGAASSAMAGGTMAAGASAALAAIPVWGWIALAALAIGGSLVTGGTPHLGGAYVAGTDGQGFKATDANYGNFGLDWGAYRSDRNAGIDGATKALAEGVAGSLSTILGKFGLDNYYQVGVRFASDNDDDSPGAIRVTNQAGEIVAEVMGEFHSEAQRGLEDLAARAGEVIQQTLLAADLPAWAEDTLKALGDSPSIDQLNTALSAIAQFEAAAGQITDTLGISTDAVYGLTKAFGGLSSAGAALSNYYQFFYSDVERTADAQAQLAEQFGALGQTMPENKAAFRSLVESIDMTTTAGQQLYAQLITLASPFATVADAVATARAAIEQEAAGLQQQIWSLTGDTASLRAAELAALDPANRALQARIYALQDEQVAQRAASDATALATAQVQAIADAWTDVFAQSGAAYAASADAALASFERAAQRERTRLTAARDAASEAVSSVRSVLDLLAGAITDLYSQVDSAAGGQAASSMALIARAAEGGYMPAREDLSAAISAARAGINGTEYASQVDADRARLILAGQLSRIQAVGSAQLPVAERALAAANEQLGALEQSAQLYRAQLNELKGIRESSRDIDGTVEDVGRLIVAELRAQSAAFSSTVIAAMQTGRVGTDVASQQLVSAGVATDRFSTVGGQQVYVSSRGAIYTSSDNMIRTNNGWAGGVDEARRIVAETFAKTSPADFYAAATRVGLSGAMIDEMYQFPAGTAAEWAKSNNLPAFAVGTDYVPDDMLALVHRGERITPAPYSGQQERLMEALIAEVQSLRATLALVAAESRRTADAVNGNPDAPMLVEAV